MAKKYLFFLVISCLFFGCNFNSIIDSNQTVEGNKWMYANMAKAEFEIADTTKAYDISFKLRINSDYRYSNIFVISSFKDSTHLKKVRHQFKLANPDGQWLGKGSGDLYTYIFPLLKKHTFTKAGKYSLAVEQNMRDNPLVGVSDIGVLITKN